jgi:hypothetical protein
VIDALEKQEVTLDSWITHEAKPEDFPTEFPSWLHPQSGLLKAVLKFT